MNLYLFCLFFIPFKNPKHVFLLCTQNLIISSILFQLSKRKKRSNFLICVTFLSLPFFLFFFFLPFCFNHVVGLPLSSSVVFFFCTERTVSTFFIPAYLKNEKIKNKTAFACLLLILIEIKLVSILSCKALKTVADCPLK